MCRPRRARSAFTLVMVLLTMVAGLAMIGAVFALHGSFNSRTVRTVDFWGDLNRMDDGLERGRLALDRWVDEGDGLPKACFKRRTAASRRVASIEDLRIAEPASELDSPWEPSELDYTLNAPGGRTLWVKVEIFDVSYTLDQLHDSILLQTQACHEARAKLPPAISGEGNYLIRSTMRVEGQSGGVVTEMALARKE